MNNRTIIELFNRDTDEWEVVRLPENSLPFHQTSLLGSYLEVTLDGDVNEYRLVSRGE